MADCVIQRLVFPTERALDPLYYRVDPPASRGIFDFRVPDRFSITLRRGSTLVTDTYFNSFFENYWQRFTHLGCVRLRLLLSGAGSVLLFRRSVVTGLTLMQSAEFEGEQQEVVLEVAEPRCHFRELGVLHFDVIARSSEVVVLKGEWLAEDVTCEPVHLVAGYCTYNRETFVLDNVRALMDDPAVAAALVRVIIVDQGTSKVSDHADYRALRNNVKAQLRVVEQANFGGSGGFTRSILEARSIPGATHMLLMDDDAIIEPESVFRAAAFLSLARDEIAVGGQMLDMVRRLEVFESGGSIDPAELGVTTLMHRAPVKVPSDLEPFLEVTYNHYNAWWFFAFPLRLVERVGLPMPVFIRGDDAEFGFRLYRAGIPTTTVPGLGVWHAPFYLKSGSWQPYYDLRNMLILTALHFPQSRVHNVKTFLRRLIKLVLAMNYFEAAVLCEAVDDFCLGPGILESDPREIHRKVLAITKTLASREISRAICLPKLKPKTYPAFQPRRMLDLAVCLMRHLFRASSQESGQPGLVVRAQEATWWTLSGVNVIALDDWYSENYRVVRRSRELFRQILWRGLKSSFRMYRHHERIGREWRGAFNRLTSETFWRRHLNLDQEGSVDRKCNGEKRNAA